jgi:hypothetical protein
VVKVDCPKAEMVKPVTSFYWPHWSNFRTKNYKESGQVSTPVLQAEPDGASSGTRFWLKSSRPAAETDLSNLETNRIEPEVLASEEEVGRAQLEEIKEAVAQNRVTWYWFF